MRLWMRRLRVMVDYGSKSIPEFYRVHVKLDDSDLYKVWTEIVVNEITTTESPMWRR